MPPTTSFCLVPGTSTLLNPAGPDPTVHTVITGHVNTLKCHFIPTFWGHRARPQIPSQCLAS